MDELEHKKSSFSLIVLTYPTIDFGDFNRRKRELNEKALLQRGK